MTSAPTAVAEQAGALWQLAEEDLGYTRGAPVNIGWQCADRLCAEGRGGVPALFWENAQGAARTFTFDDLRVDSNTIARYLQGLGLQPGERVCLFLDRVPELYLAFLGILKMGGIAQPLFSAFGEDALFTRLQDAGTSPTRTACAASHSWSSGAQSQPSIVMIQARRAGDVDRKRAWSRSASTSSTVGRQ